MTKLYIRDNKTGEVREYGTKAYDSLIVMNDGSIHYYNTETGEGTIKQKRGKKGYTFVYKNGLDPRRNVMHTKYNEKSYLDIGLNHKPINVPEHIKNIEVVYDTSWMAKVAKDFEPTRAERIFGIKE